jgi:hypothetical protein
MSDFPDSLRMSALRTFLQCPKRFELAVLDGERGEPKSERLRVGTALDRVVRQWAQDRRDVPDRQFDTIYGEALLLNAYDEAIEEDDYALPSADETHILPAAGRILETIGGIIAKVNPVLVDAKLARSLTTASGTTLDVTGTLDLTYRHPPYSSVDQGSHHLRDVKMSGKAPSEWSAANAAQDFQLRTYTWLADATPTPIDTQGWIVGRALKRDTQVLHEAADVTDAAVVQTGERLGLVASAVEDACTTGRFLPLAAMENHWSCQAKYCSLYEHVCAHGRRARTAISIEGEAAA